MDLTTVIMIFAFLLLAWGIFYIMMKIRNRMIDKNIPSNILEQFYEAERRYKLDGKSNPYQIIRDVKRDIDSANTRARDTDLYAPTGKQSEFPFSNPTKYGDFEDRYRPSEDSSGQREPNSNKSFIDRLRRK